MTDIRKSEIEALPGRWARALGGEEDRVEALRDLAGSYWYCVFAWWRRAGMDADTAAAATLGSFERWLGDSQPNPSDPGAARMREWLRARLPELAAAGIGFDGNAAIDIDPAWAEERYADEPQGEPDAIFQRRWAVTVIEFTSSTLLAEYAARGEEGLAAELLQFSGFEEPDDQSYAAAAARMGLSSGAIRKALLEFRARQGELLRSFVADTVLDPSDVNSEVMALICALDAPGPDAATAPLPAGIESVHPDEVLARAMRSVHMTQAARGHWQPPTIEEATRLFPQYQILSLLGRGGMGAVYKARQIELDRFIAIKLLPLEISVDRDFAERFRREARAMAKLDHPNIIGVYDFGATAEGHLYFSMAFVDGANLHDMIHGPGLDPPQVLEIICEVCDALAYAHAKGIVHRDIKPGNVMVSLEGHVKVADFGLARLIDSAEQLGQTMTGTVMGTRDYMAPEQMRGMHVDQRADIYSLGIMLYEMLCREVPQGVFDPPSARVAGVDSRVDQVVAKAMQQQPQRRYQFTTEMKTDVVAARSNLPAPRKAKPPAVPPAGPGKSRKPLFIGIGAATTAGAVIVVLMLAKAKGPAGTQPPTAENERGPQATANSGAAVTAQTSGPAQSSALPASTPDLMTRSTASASAGNAQAPQFYWSNFVGMPGGRGNVDGTGSAARFNCPDGVAVDASGDVYVADSENRSIRKVTPGGMVTTLLAGIGGFGNPIGLAVDVSGIVYVADDYAIWKVTPGGIITTLAGSPGVIGNADGAGGAARFNRPKGVAVDGNGNVYVAESGSHTIRKITPNGIVTTLAGSPGLSGTADGSGSAARFNSPYGIAVDMGGNLYVADRDADTVRKVTPGGVVATLAGSPGAGGNTDGAGRVARFHRPWGVAVDTSGNVYVADFYNQTIRKVTPGGVATTLAGSPGVSGKADGAGSAAQFNGPNGVTVDRGGILYVTDYGNQTIRKVTPGGVVTTVAGCPDGSGNADGMGSAARLRGPHGLTVDASGNLYVADTSNHVVRKVTPGGVVTTLAGRATNGHADGRGTSATFSGIEEIAVDISGNIYVTDRSDNTIRKVTPDGSVTTLAGSHGVVGTADGTGNAARFNNPSGLAADVNGNVYVADSSNLTIRKVTPDGAVTTLAGSPGIAGTADGTGNAARFNNPNGLAVDVNGNVYVADSSNMTIRKVTPGGVVTTLAGSPGIRGSDDGTGSAAHFNDPKGAAVDLNGNVYVADSGNSTIRKVTPDGVVTTIGGAPGMADAADGLGSRSLFSFPKAVAISSDGILYVADDGNNRISKGVLSTPPAASTTAAVPSAAIENAPPAATVASLIAATREAPFVNGLGMKFVPVPITGGPTDGQRLLFSVWDTRVQDYAVFAKETKRDLPVACVKQGPSHPMFFVGWYQAEHFCQWLTDRERAAGRLPRGWSYRLPTDHEWSCAVGIGADEDAAKLPAYKSCGLENVYPWGSAWPPPPGAGNFLGEEMRPALAAGKYPMHMEDIIPGYNDGFVETSPVGSFAANRYGLYDMGGNVWQWCDDWFDEQHKDRVFRGSSWTDGAKNNLLSSFRGRVPTGADRPSGSKPTPHDPPGTGGVKSIGFRCVAGPQPSPISEAAVPGDLAVDSSPPSAVVQAAPDSGRSSASVTAATKDAPFVNSLGMKFVPVPIIGGPTGGQRVLFSIWDTRVQDYEVFARETKNPSGPQPFPHGKWWPLADFTQGPTHPAVRVSWDEAQLFCQWLTGRERAAGRLPAGWSYRLPSDHEWSCAVGIGAWEDPAKTPVHLGGDFANVFPWGSGWPPPAGAGNYLGEETRSVLVIGKFSGVHIEDIIGGYRDRFVETSPVGSFAANGYGLYDMRGNVWQCCDDWFDETHTERVARGASWADGLSQNLQSSAREHIAPDGVGSHEVGFRCVLEIPPGKPGKSY